MYKRHTLITITQAGRERVFRESLQQGIATQYCESLLLPEKYIPNVMRYDWSKDFVPALGIVRREEEYRRAGYIPVGFSSWQRQHGQRIRIANFVTRDEVVKTTSPYEVVNLLKFEPIKFQRTKSLCALIQLIELADVNNVELGVWGSVAQEIMTGYFYTNDTSDLDVIITMSTLQDNQILALSSWLEKTIQIEKEFAIRIDTEIELSNGYGISLKEFFSKGHTVLGKGINDVQLFSKKEIFADWGITSNRQYQEADINVLTI